MVAVLALLALSAFRAQAQAPEIGSAMPCGGQRGTTVVLKIDGKNLQGATALLGGSGIRVVAATVNPSGDQLGLTLEVARDAALGPHDLRIGTSKGVAPPLRIWIDSFPEITETEPNDTPATAQKLDRTPVVVNGRIQAPLDRDVYAFDAGAGETWTFDCNAARIRSPLDPVLELRNATGHLLRMAQSAWDTDPRLVYRFEHAGSYSLTVRDTQFLGAPNYLYRLTMGPLPVVTSVLPRGGPPGQTLTLSLQGERPETAHTASVTMPTESEFPLWWSDTTASAGPALPIPLWPTSGPVVAVIEGETTQPLPSLPINLDGQFARYSQVRFAFKASSQEPLVFDLFGQRIGSQIDGALRILDARGKEVAANDDAVGKDARLVFTAPAAGIYTVEARNVMELTGPDCFYRLSVHRADPDFRVMLNVDRLQVGVDGTEAVTVTAERLDGFQGPIKIVASKLPPGVVCSGGVIPPGQNSVEITLTATHNTTLGMSEIQFQGVADLGGKSVHHEVYARDQHMPRSIDPGMFQDASYVAPFRVWEILPLGVTPRAATFALNTNVTRLNLAAGQKVELVVSARRTPGATGPIALELRGIPEKVNIAAPPIAAGQTESHVVLTVASDAPISLHNLIIQGKLTALPQTAPAIAPAVSIAIHKP